MNQNQQYGMSNGYPMPAQKKGFKLEIPQENKNLYYAFIASVVAIIVGCFLPLYKVAGETINYVYNKGDLADGIFLIILGIGAVVILLWKQKPIISLICQAISALLVFNMWSDIKKIFDSYNAYAGILGSAYKATYEIGFWIVVLGIALSIGLLIMILVKSKNSSAVATQPMAQPTNTPVMPQPVIPQQQPNVPAQQYCPYCRSPKTEGSPFCSNCGAKF